MADFLKKIAPAAGSGEKKKVVIQDIIPRKTRGVGGKKIEIQTTPTAPAVKKVLRQATKIPEEIKKQSGSLPPELPIKQWEPSRRRHFTFPKMRLPAMKFGKWTLMSAGFFILVILTGLILTTFFAHLTVTIRPVSATISITSTVITVDTKALSISLDAKKIPGLKISIEKTYQETAPSSGKKYVEDFSRGSVTIFNAYSSSPQPLVRNTRFTDNSGKIFKLIQAIVIPGAHIDGGKIVPSSIEAAVIAEKTGEEYNIPPTDFTIPGLKGTPKFAAFYGKSNNAFSGGFRGEAQTATSDDIKNSQEKVSKELFDQLKSSLQEKMPSGDEFILLDGSRNILIEEMKSPKPDTRAKDFTTTGRGIAEMIIFKKSDLLTLLGSALLSPDRPSAILPYSFQPTYKNIRLDTKNGQLTFGVEGTAVATRIVPVDELKAAMPSKRISELEAYLRARPEIGGFVLQNFPTWRWWAPSQPDAIDIKIEIPNK